MNERTIFLNSLELPSPEARAMYLDEVCADNPELRQRVESLLKAHAAEGVVDALAANGDEQTSSMIPQGNSPVRETDIEQETLSFLGPCASPGCIGSLGSYEIIEVLGRGGMGVVFKARDPKLQRIVAIKVLAPEIAANKTAKRRFEREAQAAAAVSHDHIVTIHAVDEFHNLPYLVMECIVGRSLQQKIEETGPLELKEILRIGMQAAWGLAAAHKQGLVHRDIKPANILLQNGIQRVKITDFGLARATDDVGMTHTGQIAGTPMYMSPEQAQGQRVDQLSDLFSLGSVLYTMCTGRPAFRATNTVAVLRRVCDDTPRPILEVNSELPQWLVAIVNKLMSKKQEDRYQTAAEVAELLSEHLSLVQMKGQASSVESTQPARSASANPADQAPAKLSPPPKSSNKLPRKGILLALVLGVLVMSPILFGRYLSDRFNQWFWPAIPTLPATELTTGLHFDGKDDSIEFAPVDWSYPQFTIEAFVTSAPRSDNGVIVSLTSGEKPWEIMELYDGHQAGGGKRQSGAQIMGKTPYATAYGPLTPGVRQHRALVFDGSYMHYYINGIWQGKRRAEAHEGMMWKMKHLRLGSDGDGKKLFEGQIDQVRISKVARYSSNFAAPTSVASDERTLALYNFDEGQGTVLKDASGHGHDGKIVGTKWVERRRIRQNSAEYGEDDRSLATSATKQDTGWHGWPADAPPPAIAPFNAEQAKQHQKVWAAYLKVPVEYTNTIGMKFRLIPPGEFMMGSAQEEIDAALPIAGDDLLWQDCIRSEGPQHKVILTQPIYLCVTEVTQSQYMQVMMKNPSYYAASGKWSEYVTGIETSTFPVEGVSWDDATEFCGRLITSEKLDSGVDANRLLSNPFGDAVYRLPSEAEWEFACRAGTVSQYHTGDTNKDLSRAAWFLDTSDKKTHAVGERQRNPFGLYDMHGNVWEWTLDTWSSTWYSTLTSSPVVNPLNRPATGSERMSRGGNYSSNAYSCRSASRCSEASGYSATLIGFRIALSVDAVRQALKVGGDAQSQ